MYDSNGAFTLADMLSGVKMSMFSVNIYCWTIQFDLLDSYS